jgi:hypothetical protein
MARARTDPPASLKYKDSWLALRTPEEISDERLLYDLALNSDMSDFAQPTGLSAHLRDRLYTLQQPAFLQIDEIVDISLALEDRRLLTVSPSGTLKFLLSDSDCSIVGISKNRIATVNPAFTPGLKVQLTPPLGMRYGVLFLSEAHLQILGGMSPPLMEYRDFIFEPKAKPGGPPQPQAQPTEDQPRPAAPPASFLTTSEDDFILSEDNDSDIIEMDTQPDVGAVPVARLSGARQAAGVEGFQVVHTRGRVVDCFDFKLTSRKGRHHFHLLVKIQDTTGDIVVKVAPALLDDVIGIPPADWIGMQGDEQTDVFLRCKRHFCGLAPPLTLVERAVGDPTQDRFVLVSRELADQMIQTSQ